jgi:MSHA biogenesis protein MshO
MGSRGRNSGFSLIELILVIVLLGGLLSLGAGLVIEPFLLQQDVERRTRLADSADSALQRMSREVRAALPNSLVVSGNTVSFARSVDGGRYRVQPPGDVLTIGQSDDGFQVLGTLATAPQAGQQLVVYNVAPGNSGNRATITDFDTATRVLSFASHTFPFGSPMQRFFIIDAQIQYSCSGGVLSRTVTPAGGVAQTAPLASQVDCANTRFQYDSGASSRNALLTARLTLTEAGETVSLLHQTHVLNTP